MMKLSLSFVFLIQIKAFGMHLGDPILSGKGCYGSQELRAIAGENERYELPVRIKAVKEKDQALNRQICNLRVPIALNKNEKLQILNASQPVRIVAGAATEVTSTLNLSFVGKSAEPLMLNIKAARQHKSVYQTLKKEAVVAESECGKNTMLTADLNVVLSGKAKASVTTETLLLALHVVNCN